jgi:hypothetical protein
MGGEDFVRNIEAFRDERLWWLADPSSETSPPSGGIRGLLEVALANEISASELAAAWGPHARSGREDRSGPAGRRRGAPFRHDRWPAPRSRLRHGSLHASRVQSSVRRSALLGDDRGDNRVRPRDFGSHRLRSQRELHGSICRPRGLRDGEDLSRLHPTRRAGAPKDGAGASGPARRFFGGAKPCAGCRRANARLSCLGASRNGRETRHALLPGILTLSPTRPRAGVWLLDL